MRRATGVKIGVVTAGAVAATLLSGCSPTKILGSLQPAAAGGEIEDVAYAPGARHSMDIYLPAVSKTPPPVVVFFYGGGWTSGQRAQYRFMGRSLAARGVMTFIPDYRVWPETGFPGFLQDAAEAVAAARSDARRRGGDTSRLFLMGHSAGAYIALMLALDPEWLTAAGVDPATALAGAIGISGPYDFLPLQSKVLQQIFAPAGPRTQPITFAANAKIPLLLMTGADDKTVYPENSLRLAAKVRAFGGDAQAIVFPGIGHVAAVGAFASPLHFLAPVRVDALRFMGVSDAAGASAKARPPDRMGAGVIAGKAINP